MWTRVMIAFLPVGKPPLQGPLWSVLPEHSLTGAVGDMSRRFYCAWMNVEFVSNPTDKYKGCGSGCLNKHHLRTKKRDFEIYSHHLFSDYCNKDKKNRANYVNSSSFIKTSLGSAALNWCLLLASHTGTHVCLDLGRSVCVCGWVWGWERPRGRRCTVRSVKTEIKQERPLLFCGTCLTLHTSTQLRPWQPPCPLGTSVKRHWPLGTGCTHTYCNLHAACCQKHAMHAHINTKTTSRLLLGIKTYRTYASSDV